MSFEDPRTPEAPLPPAPPCEDKEDRDERMWATLCHLSAFALFLLPTCGNLIGPLIVWLIKKDELPLVDDQGKEVLNFQISMTIYYIAAAILCCAFVGFVLLPALLIFGIVVTIMGAVKASTGVAYRYPLCIRFLK